MISTSLSAFLLSCLFAIPINLAANFNPLDFSMHWYTVPNLPLYKSAQIRIICSIYDISIKIVIRNYNEKHIVLIIESFINLLQREKILYLYICEHLIFSYITIYMKKLNFLRAYLKGQNTYYVDPHHIF